jgi:hypothetical protein
VCGLLEIKGGCRAYCAAQSTLHLQGLPRRVLLPVLSKQALGGLETRQFGLQRLKRPIAIQGRSQELASGHV